MNQQEREIIGGLFDRLKQAEQQQRDPQVDAFIKDRLAAQPGAVYAMLQTLYMSEQAMQNMNGQLEAQQAQLAQMQQHIAQLQQSQQQSGGFLSGLFGSKPAAQPPMPARPMGAPMGAPQMGMAPQGGPQPGPWGGPQGGPMGGPQPGPWGQQAQPGPWGQQPQRQGGGFLATAATAAVGVAGGMLLANAISGMMNQGSATQTASAPTSAPVPEAAPAQQDGFMGDDGGYDAGQHDASYDAGGYDAGQHDASYDAGGWDDGGGYDDV